MPIVAFLWFVGLSLYWTGTKKDAAKPRAKPKLSGQNEIVILVPAPEQEQAT